MRENVQPGAFVPPPDGSELPLWQRNVINNAMQEGQKERQMWRRISENLMTNRRARVMRAMQYGNDMPQDASAQEVRRAMAEDLDPHTPPSDLTQK